MFCLILLNSTESWIHMPQWVSCVVPLTIQSIMLFIAFLTVVFDVSASLESPHQVYQELSFSCVCKCIIPSSGVSSNVFASVEFPHQVYQELPFDVSASVEFSHQLYQVMCLQVYNPFIRCIRNCLCDVSASVKSTNQMFQELPF